MKTIRWGIIGCGDVTEVKSGPGLRLANHSELVAVMRRNGKLAEDYAKRHKVKRWYDNAQQLINDPDVDAVYVATPPSSHKEYTLMVAEAGKPVYVEKPMALNYRECREMITACHYAGVPLFVAYYRRALPRFVTIKSLIENGEIGEVSGVNILYYAKASKSDLEGKDNWRVQPGISGGGYFVDLACHTLDILQFYFGNIISADGSATNRANLYPAEDLVAGNFIFSSGVYGTGLWNFTAHDHLDRTEIIGSKGKITFATFGNSAVELQNTDGIKYLDLPNPVHIQQPLIQTIVDELNSVGKCPSTGLSAAGTSKVMDRLLS